MLCDMTDFNLNFLLKTRIMQVFNFIPISRFPQKVLMTLDRATFL